MELPPWRNSPGIHVPYSNAPLPLRHFSHILLHPPSPSHFTHRDVHTVCSWDEKAAQKIQRALEEKITQIYKRCAIGKHTWFTCSSWSYAATPLPPLPVSPTHCFPSSSFYSYSCSFSISSFIRFLFFHILLVLLLPSSSSYSSSYIPFLPSFLSFLFASSSFYSPILACTTISGRECAAQGIYLEWSKFFTQCSYLPKPFQVIEVDGTTSKTKKKGQDGNSVIVVSKLLSLIHTSMYIHTEEGFFSLLFLQLMLQRQNKAYFLIFATSCFLPPCHSYVVKEVEKSLTLNLS